MDQGGERINEAKPKWAEIIEAQAISGQSAAGYCRAQDIRYGLFLYHRRKARREHELGQAGRPSAKKIPSFIPIDVSRPGLVTIRLAGGITVESERLPDVEWLIELAARLPASGRTPC